MIAGRQPTLNDGTPYVEITAGCGYSGSFESGFQFCAYMAEADARLIKAAPDLLESLIGLIDAEGDESAMIDALFNARMARDKALNISPPAPVMTTPVETQSIGMHQDENGTRVEIASEGGKEVA